jgi:hypothetical protein
VLHGRAVEQAAIAALLDETRASRGGALVVRGQPGVGKSALLSDAVARAEGMQVLQTQGVESESPLAFAALQRLLRPVASRFGRLAARQAHALRVAFGEEEGAGQGGDTDRFVVFLGALSLLAEAAEDAPVLAVVDDAQWLDEDSAAALLFVARRVATERVALLFGAREGDVRRFDSRDLPTLTVRGLDSVAAVELLARRTGSAVPTAVAEQLVARTAGNPLALVELPEALSAEQLAGTAPLPPQLPVTEGVERVFLDRARRLPDARRRCARPPPGSVSTTTRSTRWSGPGSCGSATGRWSCGIRSCGRRSTRPRRAPRAGRRTARSPRRCPARRTPTGVPGTGPRRLRTSTRPSPRSSTRSPSGPAAAAARRRRARRWSGPPSSPQGPGTSGAGGGPRPRAPVGSGGTMAVARGAPCPGARARRHRARRGVSARAAGRRRVAAGARRVEHRIVAPRAPHGPDRGGGDRAR